MTAQEECASLSALRDTYFTEMHRLGATVEKETLWPSILHQTLLDKMKLLPWLIGQYHRVHQETGFENWSRWVGGAIALTCDYVQRCIGRGNLYQGH